MNPNLTARTACVEQEHYSQYLPNSVRRNVHEISSVLPEAQAFVFNFRYYINLFPPFVPSQNLTILRTTPVTAQFGTEVPHASDQFRLLS